MHQRSGESILENPVDLSFVGGGVENIRNYFIDILLAHESIFFVFLTIAESKTEHFEGVLVLPSCLPGTGWGRLEFKPQNPS